MFILLNQLVEVRQRLIVFLFTRTNLNNPLIGQTNNSFIEITYCTIDIAKNKLYSSQEITN